MNYQKQYADKINWKNSPDTSTPLNATNLNKMDNALNYMDEKLSEAINGGIVEANPSETAEESLNKVAINGTVYGLSGGGGGSYTAGNGISITNNVITNTRKGALTGVIDSVSSNIAHTQIDNALTTTTAGALVVLKAEASGTSIDTVRVQYGAQASESNDFRLRDTSGNYTTIDVAIDDTIIMMLNATGYQMVVLSILGASTGGGYAGLGIGKKTGVTSNVIDTDIDLHRAPMAGDRLLIWFDEKVTNPTGLITYNNGTAVTSNLENVTPLYINAGWNIVQFMNDGLLYNNVWVRKQNVPIPNNTLVGLSDTAIISPSDGQLLTYDNETQKWKNKTYVEANMGFSDTELKKLKVGNVVYDTDGLRDYFVTNIANNNITISVLNSNQFVMENIAINTGAHSGSSSAWNLILDDGMYPVLVALKNADGTAFSDDIHENELLLVYVDTAGNVARVLDIPVDNIEVKTATGNPITLTDAVAGNAIEVSAEIVASQDLHGYDHPWVGGAGANMLHLLTPTEGWSDTVNGVIVVTPSSGNVNKDLFYGTLEEGKYTVKDFTGGSNATHQIALFKNDNVLAYITDNSQTFTVTSTSDTYRIRVYVYSGNTDTTIKPICCKGESISAYSPWENICPIIGFSSVVITNVDAESQTATVTVALGQTVYGGTLDLTSGELTVTHANIASYNGETIGEPWISSMDEYTQGGTPTTGAQVVYTLATPTTTTLTAAQLALVKGYNQLSCNSGDMEITYKASGLDALKERVDELEDAVEDIETDLASKAENSVVGTVESGTTASQPYAVGEHFIRNDKFCTCIATIASGATLTLNTNYVEGTIAECIARQGTYSTTETKIGTWRGHDLYRVVVDLPTLPNNATKFYTDLLPDNITIKRIEGYYDDGTYVIPIPFCEPQGLSGTITIGTQKENGKIKIYVQTGQNRSSANGYAIVEYIKS